MPISSHSFDELILLTSIPSEVSVLSWYKIFIFYRDIFLKKLVDSMLFSWKRAVTAITITGISIALFRGNLLSEASLVFIFFIIIIWFFSYGPNWMSDFNPPFFILFYFFFAFINGN